MGRAFRQKDKKSQGKNRIFKKTIKIGKHEFDQKIVLGVVFILGFLIAVYPIISQMYYSVESTQEIKDFDENRERMARSELNRKI